MPFEGDVGRIAGECTIVGRAVFAAFIFDDASVALSLAELRNSDKTWDTGARAWGCIIFGGGAAVGFAGRVELANSLAGD
jgi:hypothetical protein